jgi:hypothetical protein
MHPRGARLRRLLLQTGGSCVALVEARRLLLHQHHHHHHHGSASPPAGSPTLLLLGVAACDAAAPSAPPARAFTTGPAGRKKKRGRGGGGDDGVPDTLDDSAGVPAKIDLNKALGDMKEASEAVGGALKRDEALALVALLAREVMMQQTGAGGGDRDPRLRSTLVSPPVSGLRTRERSKRFLEYATLCEVGDAAGKG